MLATLIKLNFITWALYGYPKVVTRSLDSFRIWLWEKHPKLGNQNGAACPDLLFTIWLELRHCGGSQFVDCCPGQNATNVLPDGTLISFESNLSILF